MSMEVFFMARKKEFKDVRQLLTENLEKAYECEGLVRMFLRFRFCGIVCCVLYRFSFPQSDL